MYEQMKRRSRNVGGPTVKLLSKSKSYQCDCLSHLSLVGLLPLISVVCAYVISGTYRYNISFIDYSLFTDHLFTFRCAGHIVSITFVP